MHYDANGAEMRDARRSSSGAHRARAAVYGEAAPVASSSVASHDWSSPSQHSQDGELHNIGAAGGSNNGEMGADASGTTNVILEQDRFLPIANISRIMKSVLPSEGKLSKDAKECIQECITEFLLFITSEASEKCTMERRKTITGDDLLMALQTLGFDEYVEPLREFLKKYREANRGAPNSKEEYEGLTHNDNNNTVVYQSMVPGTSFEQQQQPMYAMGGMPSASTIVYENGQSQEKGTAGGVGHHQPVQLMHLSNQSLHSAAGAAQQQQLEMIGQQSAPPTVVPSTLQPLQIFVDSTTGQHYICTQGPDGSQNLMAVNLTPAGLPVAASVGGTPAQSAHHLPPPPTEEENAPPIVVPPARKRDAGGRLKRNAAVSMATGAEQSVRHYLQSQQGFKLRKNAIDDN